MFLKLTLCLLVNGALASCNFASDAKAQEPEYLIKAMDDSPRSKHFHSETVEICHASEATKIVRITTPVLGLTDILIKGGLICEPGETPDVVLSARECRIVSGEFKGSLDESCDNK